MIPKPNILIGRGTSQTKAEYINVQWIKGGPDPEAQKNNINRGALAKEMYVRTSKINLRYKQPREHILI